MFLNLVVMSLSPMSHVPPRNGGVTVSYLGDKGQGALAFRVDRVTWHLLNIYKRQEGF